MSDYDRIEALSEEIENLKGQIDAKRKKDSTMTKVVLESGGVPSNEIRRNASKVCRALKGHYGKVYAMQWGGTGNNIVSASQGGQLIVWNANSTNKVQAVELKTSWVMSCAIEQKKSNLMACGGLDNVCSVYHVDRTSFTANDPKSELATELADGHSGYVSCCRFVNDKHIFTASGDSTCLYWDVERNAILAPFLDHTGDVMFVALRPDDEQTILTGSIDKTAKLWDVRTHSCVQTHYGHDGDVNSVAFFPDGHAFGTGSEDHTCRLFDTRSHGELRKFAGLKQPVTSVDFSRSGRLLFAGCTDHNAYAYDVLGTTTTDAPALEFVGGHDKRVTCLGVSPTGDALCTGGWDNNLKIWA